MVPTGTGGGKAGGGYNAAPMINFPLVSASAVTMGVLAYVPNSGGNLIIPADGSTLGTGTDVGFALIFNSDWTYIDASNTFFVEIVFFASHDEYYTLDSMTLASSAIAVNDSSGIVQFSSFGGGFLQPSSDLNLRARFTPIGAPNPIVNCTVAILL